MPQFNILNEEGQNKEVFNSATDEQIIDLLEKIPRISRGVGNAHIPML